MAIKHVGSVDISEEEAERLLNMQDQAVKDSDPVTGSTMIAMRWGRLQLRMVRQAAELRGVPYQVYIRNAAWEMATRDLESARLVTPKS